MFKIVKIAAIALVAFSVFTQTASAGGKPERYWWDNGGSGVQAYTCEAAIRDFHETVSTLMGHLHIGDQYTHPNSGYLTHDEAVTMRIWLQNYSSESTRGMYSQKYKVNKGSAHVNTCNELRVQYELGLKWVPDLLKEKSPWF